MGESGEVLADTIEIIDLGDNSTECQSWHYNTPPVRGAVGGFVNGGVLICGGSTDAENNSILTRQCYHNKPDESIVSSIVDQVSIGSSSIVFENSLFISGGYNSLGKKIIIVNKKATPKNFFHFSTKVH